VDAPARVLFFVFCFPFVRACVVRAYPATHAQAQTQTRCIGGSWRKKKRGGQRPATERKEARRWSSTATPSPLFLSLCPLSFLCTHTHTHTRTGPPHRPQQLLRRRVCLPEPEPGARRVEMGKSTPETLPPSGRGRPPPPPQKQTPPPPKHPKHRQNPKQHTPPTPPQPPPPPPRPPSPTSLSPLPTLSLSTLPPLPHFHFSIGSSTNASTHPPPPPLPPWAPPATTTWTSSPNSSWAAASSRRRWCARV